MLYMPGVSCNIIVVMVDAVAVHAKTFYLDISVMMVDAVNALTYIISVAVGVVENRVAGDLVVNFDCFEQQRCYFFFCHTTIQVSWKQNSC